MNKKDFIIGIVLALIGIIICIFISTINLSQDIIIFGAAYCVVFLPIAVIKIFKGIFGG